ncbi:unnamed protein product [Owenia fusiformis]|uniref:CCHC-type domain-containing protein n=1 Tax=Owenia fusiformis TaxID=6347 RepID=A0A8S4NT68_OWEFU|nr:unnamed protein product [Owenia fusiformis]
MEEATLLQVKELLKDSFTSFKRELKEETETQSTKLFKKFRADSNDNIDLKNRGNRKQHEFNIQVANSIEEAAEYLKRAEQATDFEKQQQLLDEVKRCNTEGISLLHKRNKLIRLADGSETGWLAVDEYEQKPIASDSEDDKRLKQSDREAARKLKSRKAKSGGRYSYFRYGRGGFRGGRGSSTPPNTESNQWQQGAGGGNGFKRTPKPSDICFRCGQTGHWSYMCSRFSGNGSDSRLNKQN